MDSFPSMFITTSYQNRDKRKIAKKGEPVQDGGSPGCL